MRGITELDTLEYLSKLNEIRMIADEFLNVTDVMEIRKKQPTFTGNETDAEKIVKIREQAEQNIREILLSCLENHREISAKLLEAMIVYDKGEKHLTGAQLVKRAMREIQSESVMDFLLLLMKSAGGASAG